MNWLRRLAVDTTPLQVPAFKRLFLGTVVTVIGTQMTLVAVPVQAYLLTGSSLVVGLTSIVALVPLVIFGLLGGAIADAMDRRVLLLITSSGAALTAIGLFLQSLLPGGGSLLLLWILVFLQSACFAVNAPTRSATIPALVGLARVPAANALNMTITQAGIIGAPLIAGLLIGAGDLSLTYAVDAVGLLIALPLLRGLPPLLPGGAGGVDGAGGEVGAGQRDRAGQSRINLVGAIRSVAEGFAFLRTQPVLLMTFVVDIIAMVFGFPRAVLPELAATTFADSSNALGWLFAAMSIGAVVAGLLSGPVARVKRQGLVILVAIVVWGIAVALFGLTSSLFWAVFFLAMSGAADMVSAVLRTSILQSGAPDAMRGRMQGVFIVVVAGGPRLGDLRAGAMAAAVSIPATMVSGGLFIIAAMVVVAIVVPTFRRYRCEEGPGATETSSP
ncbi:MAG: MFS transporter [Geodermatophilaceae bacterium]|nr:MFS transporter [Geodermatophilaceae bacterium]